MAEFALKNEITMKMIDICKSSGIMGGFKCSDDWMRGFIFGAETARGVEIPAHWYDEIMADVKKGVGGKKHGYDENLEWEPVTTTKKKPTKPKSTVFGE